MKRDKAINRALSIFFTILSLAWIYPVFMIALNSFKKATAISTTTAFDLLTPETFNGLANYVHALNEQGFASAFMYSLIITVTSVVLILVCCSMCAWYVVRVNSKISNFFYYLFVFSMVVPFQMLMFTLSNLADRIGFNTPFNICFIYLGFGAGLAVFMFAGFVKNIPLEIEEAAMIDGCNPVQVFFKIVLPIMKPTYLSVGILETMWVWNDYLLPYLTLDSTKYKTIPILIQYFRGGYGHVELGPMMACIMMVVIPIVIMYIFCQKYIIDGVVAGAVKGWCRNCFASFGGAPQRGAAYRKVKTWPRSFSNMFRRCIPTTSQKRRASLAKRRRPRRRSTTLRLPRTVCLL